MNRRAAFALFAVSLTMLPACVTKVVVEAPTTTEGLTTTTVSKSDIRSTRIREFMASLQRETTLTNDERLSVPGIALKACESFDEGMDVFEWLWSQGFDTDGNIGEREKLMILVARNAVRVLCPENTSSVLNQ
jgi:hypothetical protein